MKFDQDTLNTVLLRDEAQLIGEYPKMNKRIRIYFRCKCGEEGNKLAHDLIKNYGAYCKSCTTYRSINKLHDTLTKKRGVAPLCTLESLYEVIQRDQAVLLEEYSTVSNRLNIHFRCQCGEECSKESAQLITVSGAYCKICTRTRWTQKKNATNLERYGHINPTQGEEISKRIKEKLIETYGVDNLFKLPIIKEKIKQTVKDKYGVEYISQSKIVRQKMKETSLKKYGTENPAQSEVVKAKMRKTNMERYGVEQCMHHKAVHDKSKKTMIERYGVDHTMKHPVFLEKAKQTFMAHYGVSNPNKDPTIRAKIRKTCLERYGYEVASQSPEIMEKTQNNGKKYKPFTMPSGIIRNVQGYEPFALKELLQVYSEDDIKTDRKDVPRITYETNGKKRYYFPDIYIPSKNLIIEVKSTWTAKSKCDNIKEKEEATLATGYSFEMQIYDKKGNQLSGSITNTRSTEDIDSIPLKIDHGISLK